MNKVGKIVRQIVREITGVSRVSVWKDLRIIGLESLSFAELIAQLEDLFQIKLPAAEIIRFRNLRSLIKYVKEMIG